MIKMMRRKSRITGSRSSAKQLIETNRDKSPLKQNIKDVIESHKKQELKEDEFYLPHSYDEKVNLPKRMFGDVTLWVDEPESKGVPKGLFEPPKERLTYDKEVLALFDMIREYKPKKINPMTKFRHAFY